MDYARTFDLSLDQVNDNLERIDSRKVGLQEFIEKYEKPYRPCIITHLQDDWDAIEKWTKKVLYNEVCKLAYQVWALNVFHEYYK